MAGSDQSNNPEDQYIQRERDMLIAEAIAQYVVYSLPPRQQLAMLCYLKKKASDVLLIHAFQKRGVDLEAVVCPTDKAEQGRLRSLLTIARKKLQAHLKELEQHSYSGWQKA